MRKRGGGRGKGKGKARRRVRSLMLPCHGHTGSSNWLPYWGVLRCCRVGKLPAGPVRWYSIQLIALAPLLLSPLISLCLSFSGMFTSFCSPPLLAFLPIFKVLHPPTHKLALHTLIVPPYSKSHTLITLFFFINLTLYFPLSVYLFFYSLSFLTLYFHLFNFSHLWHMVTSNTLTFSKNITPLLSSSITDRKRAHTRTDTHKDMEDMTDNLSRPLT